MAHTKDHLKSVTDPLWAVVFTHFERLVIAGSGTHPKVKQDTPVYVIAADASAALEKAKEWYCDTWKMGPPDPAVKSVSLVAEFTVLYR